MKPTKAIFAHLTLCISLCTIFTVAQAATLYKWVDDDGNVRYTDNPPIKKGHKTLNSQGVVIKSTNAPKTKEELANEKKAGALARKQLEKERKQKQDRAAKDRVLLMTFSSEEELGLVKNNRTEVIESVIRLIDKSIVSTRETLIRHVTNAQTLYLSKGLEIPGGLAQNIEHYTKKLSSRKDQRQLKQSEKDKIEHQFSQDIERYRFLVNQ